MDIGDFAELTREHNDCEGLCCVIAVDGSRVTVRTESGKIMTVHERSLNAVPGPEELARLAAEIRERNNAALAARPGGKFVSRPSALPEFAWDRKRSMWGRIA